MVLSSTAKCFLIYMTMSLVGFSFLFLSHGFPLFFLTGILLSSIGFHELCHLIALYVMRYSVAQILSSPLKFGMVYNPRSVRDAFFASLLPLVGVPVFLGIFLRSFPEFSYQTAIFVFVLSLPDVYIFFKWTRKRKT